MSPWEHLPLKTWQAARYRCDYLIVFLSCRDSGITGALQRAASGLNITATARGDRAWDENAQGEPDVVAERLRDITPAEK